LSTTCLLGGGVLDLDLLRVDLLLAPIGCDKCFSFLLRLDG
jgi:hypothetical protein